MLASLIFIAGIAVAMFPKRLPSGMMRDAVHSILVLASGTERDDVEEEEEEEEPSSEAGKNEFVMFL